MKGQKVKKMDLLNRNEQLEVEARENLYKAPQAGIKLNIKMGIYNPSYFGFRN